MSVSKPLFPGEYTKNRYLSITLKPSGRLKRLGSGSTPVLMFVNRCTILPINGCSLTDKTGNIKSLAIQISVVDSIVRAFPILGLGGTVWVKIFPSQFTPSIILLPNDL